MKFKIVGSATIGRSANADFTINEKIASRKHAMFTLQDDNLFIEDLGSANGTFVNVKKISAKTRLANNDKIRIGKTLIRVLISRSSVPESAPLDTAKAETAQFGELKPPENLVAKQKISAVSTPSEALKEKSTKQQTARPIGKSESKAAVEQKTKVVKEASKKENRAEKAQEQAVEIVTKQREIKRTDKKKRIFDNLGILSFRYSELAGASKLVFTILILVLLLVFFVLGFLLFGGGEDKIKPDKENKPYKITPFEEYGINNGQSAK